MSSGAHEILVLSHLVPWPTTSGVLLRCYNLLRETARRYPVHLYALNQEVLLPQAAIADSIRHLESFCAEVRVFPLSSSRAAYAGLLARNTFSALPYSVPRFYSPDLEAAQFWTQFLVAIDVLFVTAGLWAFEPVVTGD